MLELASSKRLHVVMFNAGVMTCSVHALEGPLMAAPIDESEDTIFDLVRLTGIARDATSPPPDLKVLKVSAGLQRGADAGAALWSISFVDGQGYPKGQVTIDSISHGRFGLNMITGWQEKEYSQMGIWPGDRHFEHRYDYCREYVTVMREMWANGHGHFKGDVFQIDECRTQQLPTCRFPSRC